MLSERFLMSKVCKEGMKASLRSIEILIRKAKVFDERRLFEESDDALEEIFVRREDDETAIDESVAHGRGV
jgi:hypothetical protein